MCKGHASSRQVQAPRSSRLIHSSPLCIGFMGATSIQGSSAWISNIGYWFISDTHGPRTDTLCTINFKNRHGQGMRKGMLFSIILSECSAPAGWKPRPPIFASSQGTELGEHGVKRRYQICPHLCFIWLIFYFGCWHFTIRTFLLPKELARQEHRAPRVH